MKIAQLVFFIDLCSDKLFWSGARRKMMNCVVALVHIVTDSQMNVGLLHRDAVAFQDPAATLELGEVGPFVGVTYSFFRRRRKAAASFLVSEIASKCGNSFFGGFR